MSSPPAVDLPFVSALQHSPTFTAGSALLGAPGLVAALVAYIVVRTSWRIARALASAAVMLGLLAVAVGLYGMRTVRAPGARAPARPELSSRAALGPGEAAGDRGALAGLALGALPVGLGLGAFAVSTRRRRRERA